MSLSDIDPINEYMAAQLRDMQTYKKEIEQKEGQKVPDERIIILWCKHRAKEFHNNFNYEDPDVRDCT